MRDGQLLSDGKALVKRRDELSGDIFIWLAVVYIRVFVLVFCVIILIIIIAIIIILYVALP